MLPSPNGSAIAAAAGDTVVVSGCLRDASAVARTLAQHGCGTAGRPVVVIASGERWPDGSLRPALEDLLGAGAIIAGLESQWVGPLCPEAVAARAAFTQTADVAGAVTACSSGNELVQGGFTEDVAIATELDSSEVVPVLTDRVFQHGKASNGHH